MDSYKNNFDQLRRQVNDTISRLQKVQQGISSVTEETQVHIDVGNANKAFKALQSQFSHIPQSQPDIKTLDEQMRYLSSRFAQLNQNYQSFQAKNSKTLEVDAQETFGGYEQAQQLKQQKDQNIDILLGKAKTLGAQNKLISEKLLEGDEVMKELHGDVDLARDQVGAATSRVKQFSQYLKKNKSPFIVCIIVLIISVFFWSTKAFCSIGFTWQCN